MNVLLKGAAQPDLFLRIQFSKGDEIPVKHIIGFSAQNISKTAGHAGTKVQAERPEDDGHAAGHVFATVLADTFDNGKRTAVADSETLPGTAGDAMKILPNLFIARKAVLAPAHQFPAEAGTNAAIRVLNRLRLILETERGMEMKRFFKRPVP